MTPFWRANPWITHPTIDRHPVMLSLILNSLRPASILSGAQERGFAVAGTNSDDQVLPDLTAISGLEVTDLLELVSPSDRRELQKKLEEMVRVRRQAEADSATLRLS